MDYFNDIEFVLCGYMDKAQMNTRNRLFEGYYGLQYLHSGALNVQIGDNPPEYFDSPGVFVTYPGASFTYGSPAGTARNHAYICFKGPRAERYFAEGLLECRETGVFHDIINPEEFLNTVNKLINYINLSDVYSHARAVLLLEELLLQIREQREPSERQHMRYAPELRKLRDNIAVNPLKKWDFSREASRIGLSYIYFCRLFKQLTGRHRGHFIWNAVCTLRRVCSAIQTNVFRR